jgi:hypothetical protein
LESYRVRAAAGAASVPLINSLSTYINKFRCPLAPFESIFVSYCAYGTSTILTVKESPEKEQMETSEK